MSEGSNQSESGQERCQVVQLKKGVSYDVDGKFSYSQVCLMMLPFQLRLETLKLFRLSSAGSSQTSRQLSTNMASFLTTPQI